MPIRQRDGKWYWGSKGPFTSRKKAEAVAQAAHASGYVKKLLGERSDYGVRQEGEEYPKTAAERAKEHGHIRTGTIIKYGLSSFGNPQGNATPDVLGRGAEKPKGWKGVDRNEEESAVEKLKRLTKANPADKVDANMPSNYQGKMGAKRIDWRKKRTPDFEKRTRVASPTHSVHETSIDTTMVKHERRPELDEWSKAPHEAEETTEATPYVSDDPSMPKMKTKKPSGHTHHLKKDIWLSKFMDISRQRVIAYILKEADEEEEAPSTQEEPPTGPPLAEAGIQQFGEGQELPPNRIEIAVPEQAPKGTRLIQGPRGGLYYVGDPEQGTNIEHQEYGKTFTNARKQLMKLMPEADRKERLYRQYERDLKNYALETIDIDIHDDPQGWSDAKNELQLNDPIYREREEATLYRAEEWNKVIAKVEPLQIKALNALLKIAAHLPTVEGEKIQINPDIQLGLDHDSYTEGFSMSLRRSELLGGLKALGHGQIPIIDLPDYLRSLTVAKQGELHDYIENRVSLLGESGMQGGHYIASSNKIYLNPVIMQGLFGSNPQKYMKAIHTVTHEVIHSVNKDREHGQIIAKMKHRMLGMQMHNRDTGNRIPLFSHPALPPEETNRLWAEYDQHFRFFINEGPTEMIAQMMLNQRYRNPKNKREAEDRADSSKFSLPGGDTIGGYKDMMPTFSRFLLVKNGMSPKAARQDAIRMLKETDTNVIFNEFIHFLAVSSKVNGPTVNTPGLRARETDRERCNNMRQAVGSMNTEAWASPHNRIREMGGTEPSDGVTKESWLDLNSKDLESIPTNNDIKHLIYGEQGNDN